MLDPKIAKLMQGLSEKEQIMFLSEYNSNRKNPTLGIILCITLGFVGVHKFYLGSVLDGMSVLFFSVITAFILGIIFSIWDVFFIAGKIKKKNYETAQKIKDNIIMLRS